MKYGGRPARSGETTCWSLIRRASAGEEEDRRLFAGRYEAFVRALLSARWRGSPLAGELEDAVQDVFVECFRSGGVLWRAEADCVRAFRPFLVGVVRNIARRIEGRRRPLTFSDALPEDGSDDTPSGIPSGADPPSRDVERAWARALMGEARDLLEARSRQAGEDARRRLALLELRFQEGVPIREIARRWGSDPTRLHREFDRARREFRAALIDVVAAHHPGTAAEVEHTCGQLILALQS
jgi:RNA polymerase sigma factor (sigma-70 family)